MFSISSFKKLKPKQFFVMFLFSVLTSIFIFSIQTIDIVNTRNFLYSSSFIFTSQNPYFQGYQYSIATPPVFFSLLIPMFIIYLETGNLVLSFLFLRIANLVFTLGVSIIIYKIVYKTSSSNNRSHSAWISILLSPILFFISFIYSEQSIFGIFLMLIGIYLIFFVGRKNLILEFAGVFIIVYSIFLYYFPALLVIPIILYSKDKSIAIARTILFFMAGSATFLLFKLIFSYNLLVSGAASVTGYSDIPIFNILAVFTKGIISQPYSSSLTTLQNTLNFLFLFLIILLPIIFRIYKKDLILLLSILFILPFLLLRIFNWDEFVWIIPFSILTIARLSNERRLKLKLLGVQLFYLPILILFNMFAAPTYGQGTGIFYLTYYQFHKAIPLFTYVPRYVQVTAILDILNFFFIFCILLYECTFLKTNRSTFQIEFTEQAEYDRIGYATTNHLKSNHLKISILMKRVWKNIVFNRKFIVVLLAFSLFFISIIGIFDTNSTSALKFSNGKFPLGAFDSNTNLMNNTSTYVLMNNGTTLYITNSNISGIPTPIFARTIINESLNFNISFTPFYRVIH